MRNHAFCSFYVVFTKKLIKFMLWPWLDLLIASLCPLLCCVLFCSCFGLWMCLLSLIINIWEQWRSLMNPSQSNYVFVSLIHVFFWNFFFPTLINSSILICGLIFSIGKWSPKFVSSNMQLYPIVLFGVYSKYNSTIRDQIKTVHVSSLSSIIHVISYMHRKVDEMQGRNFNYSNK